MGEVLALLEDGRNKGAVGAGSHALPSVELPHMWLFSLCSCQDLQKSQQEFFSLLTHVLTLFMVTHSDLAAGECYAHCGPKQKQAVNITVRHL